MKFYITICLSFLIPMVVFSKEHLVLQFDVNQTLIGTDKASNKSLDDVINHILAKRYYDYWDETVTEPLSYADYVYEVKVPGKRGDNFLKRKRTKLINNFVDYVTEANHPKAEQIKNIYDQVLAKFNDESVYVVPSFYKFLEFIEKEGYQYNLILRSFGRDLASVKQAIEKQTDLRFSQERLNFFRGELFTTDQIEPIKDETIIYNFLKSHGHISIQDNWKEWQDHNQDGAFGKPIFVDPADKGTLVFFFDDHLEKPSSPHNVGTVINAQNGQVLPLVSYFNTQVFAVDFIEALLNEDYFIELFQKSKILL
ncbi:MAG: hypothetical protein P0S95_03085 [Rhabdochlamydiaceae bacterium]|nr:hypothetical protein [Candidatus Amphrikana amoebophyrae]